MPSIEARTTPDEIVPVVVGIIYHPDKRSILISKRTEKQHLAGFWEFPGGKIEAGEDAFHALQRELKEELDINVQAAIPLKQITHSYVEKTVELHFWKVTYFTGQEKSCENQELQWVDINDLNTVKFPEVNQSIIKSLNLPCHWMITNDYDEQNESDYLNDIQWALNRHSIKLLLFRSKDLKDDSYFNLANKIKEICSNHHCQLLLNRDEIDLSIENVGWHLTSKALHHFKRSGYPENLFVSASCHHLNDLNKAELENINCVLLSPVKQTKNYEGSDLLGWTQFKGLANQSRVAIYALGGLSKQDLTVAQYHGAIGIAGISLFTKRNVSV